MDQNIEALIDTLLCHPKARKALADRFGLPQEEYRLPVTNSDIINLYHEKGTERRHEQLKHIMWMAFYHERAKYNSAAEMVMICGYRGRKYLDKKLKQLGIKKPLDDRTVEDLVSKMLQNS